MPRMADHLAPHLCSGTRVKPQGKQVVTLVNQSVSVNVSRQVPLFPLSVALISDRCLSGSQPVDMNALFNDELVAIGEELERIRTISSFVEWVSKSEFLRHQQPEPMVGDLLERDSFPKRLEAQGIRGLSTYTALFHHVDMQIFTCKICGHVVSGEPEDAITHQRAAHFGHYPYRCSQPQWYVSFLLSRALVSRAHFVDSARCASQTKRQWWYTRMPLGTSPTRQQRSVTCNS